MIVFLQVSSTFTFSKDLPCLPCLRSLVGLDVSQNPRLELHDVNILALMPHLRTLAIWKGEPGAHNHGYTWISFAAFEAIARSFPDRRGTMSRSRSASPHNVVHLSRISLLFLRKALYLCQASRPTCLDRLTLGKKVTSAHSARPAIYTPGKRWLGCRPCFAVRRSVNPHHRQTLSRTHLVCPYLQKNKVRRKAARKVLRWAAILVCLAWVMGLAGARWRGLSLLCSDLPSQYTASASHFAFSVSGGGSRTLYIDGGGGTKGDAV